MFDFKNAESVVVDFPTKLYWSIAGSVTVLLLIGQLFLALPEWTINTINFLHLSCLKNSRLYTEADQRKKDKDKLTREKRSVVRRGTNESEGKNQSTEGQDSSKNLANGMNTPRKENGVEQKGQLRNVWPLLGRRNQSTRKGKRQV
jgi:hypothetical protein